MDKPEMLGSTPENEYFHKLNKEQAAKYRAKLDEERRQLEAENNRKLHWMKCPKCGSDLKEEELTGVMVDSCYGCGGVFLDKGELDLLKEGGEHRNFLVSLNELVFKRKGS